MHEVDRSGIVFGPAAPEKRELARKLRREMTPAEAVLWEALRGGRLGVHFRRQQVIDGFIADFYCHATGLVIECDGEVHERQRTYDEDRDAVLTGRGLEVLRFTNEEVLTGTDGVVSRIAEAVRRRVG